MYIAMNRFEIALGKEKEFESRWRERESYLDEVEGIRQFRLLRGAPGDNATLFLSHSEWDSIDAFDAWRQSDVFRKAHGQSPMPKGLILGHPKFEGYTTVAL
jgi:heme-degrading monooxygenase HmoA